MINKYHIIISGVYEIVGRDDTVEGDEGRTKYQLTNHIDLFDNRGMENFSRDQLHDIAAQFGKYNIIESALTLNCHRFSPK